MNESTRAAIKADKSIRSDVRALALGVLNERAPLEPILVTQAQAARMLNVSRITIYRMAKEGKLTRVQVRGATRYRLEELKTIGAGE